MKQRSLINVIPLQSDGDAIIPESFLHALQGKYKIAVYVKSRGDVVIKSYDKNDDEKVFNVYLEIEKNEMRPVVAFIGQNISKDRIIWTSGFCVPESGEKLFSDYDACMWQGVLKFPDRMTVDDVNVFFKEVNIRNDKRIITSATVEEV